MNSLYDETKIGNIKLKNRIIRSATDVCLADAYGYIPADFVDLNIDLAKGGVGMVILGFTTVAGLDYRRKGLLNLSSDLLVGQYRKMIADMHGLDCPVIPQLAMGVYYKDQKTGQRATAETKNEDLICIDPDDMTEEDIKDIVKLFTDAALRAEKAGFDGIQLHCAHCFLLDAFTNPRVNHRTDNYGGSLENRYRLITDIIQAIKKAAPNMTIIAKVNAGSLNMDGKANQDSIEGCKLMEKYGIDAIEVSGDGSLPMNIMPGRSEGYYVDVAKEISDSVNIPVIITGGFRTLGKIEDLIENGVEYLSMSRPFIREPDILARWGRDEFAPSDCISCQRCFNTYGHQCARQAPKYTKGMDGRFFRAEQGV